MFWLAVCALLAALPTTGRASTGITPGTPTQLQFPGAGYSTEFHFDVPEGVQQFRVELSGGTSTADLDLAIRFGTPFPTEPGLGFYQLMEYAHYTSISAEAREYMVVGPQSVRPPRAGRWHIALINHSATPTPALLRVDFQTPSTRSAQFVVQFGQSCPLSDPDCFCKNTPWNDPATGPLAPGNSGTTLGQKRRNAFNEALRILSQRLTAEAPIRVVACFNDLGADSPEGVTLASAGPTYTVINDSTLVPRRRDGTILRDSDGALAYTPAKALHESAAHYSAAAFARQAGTDGCRAVGGSCSEPQVFVQFNSQVDTPTALGERGFYYGVDPRPNTSTDVDFVTVALHELVHGLGFSSNLQLAEDAPARGSRLDNRDDIYGRQVGFVSGGEIRPLMSLSNSERLTALRSGRDLQWLSVETLAATPLRVSTDLGLRLHAPSTIVPGSSLSHLATIFNPDELMEPFAALPLRNLGVAEFMLHAVGWSPKVRAFPQALQIYTGLWFDPQRPGHGVDFQPVSVNSPYDHALAMFYSYDQDGQPEYYIATGPMVDGVFVPTPGPGGNALVRYLLVNGQPQVDSSSRGYMRIDFNDAARSGACQREGTSASSARRAAMLVMINDVATDWCVEPLLEQPMRETPDRTGVWINAASNDPGWGLTLAPFRTDASTDAALFGIVYYHDGNGQPRWAFTQTDAAYQPGMNLPLNSIAGYCRNCPPNARQATAVGQLQLQLIAPEQGNSAALNISFPGTPATLFQRASTPIGRLSAPPRLLNGN